MKELPGTRNVRGANGSVDVPRAALRATGSDSRLRVGAGAALEPYACHTRCVPMPVSDEIADAFRPSSMGAPAQSTPRSRARCA